MLRAEEMELYGIKSRSIPQKIVIHLVEVLLLWCSFWILFQGGGAWCQEHLNIHNAAGGRDRRIILFVFSGLTFLRIAVTMIFLLKRKMPLEETVSVSFAFVLYYTGFTLLVLPRSKALGGMDLFAILLFITGCVLNTGGEILRHRWKMKPENEGKIYTRGFFRYSRHINYFGDLLWVTAYALVTRNWFSVLIPLFLFGFFAFYNAPKLDQYLKSKYGADYDAYAGRTKMLIPFLF